MTYTALIIIGILVYPVVAFLFFCLLGFNNRACDRVREQETKAQKETAKEQEP